MRASYDLMTQTADAATEESAAKTDAGSGKMNTFSKAALGAGLVLGGALAYGIDKSISAAEEGEVSQAKLDAALRATHQSVQAMGPALDQAQASARNLGFGNDAARSALTGLEIATGSTKPCWLGRPHRSASRVPLRPGPTGRSGPLRRSWSSRGPTTTGQRSTRPKPTSPRLRIVGSARRDFLGRFILASRRPATPSFRL